MKIGLLPRILIAIVLGIVFGQFLNEELVRVLCSWRKHHGSIGSAG